MSTETSRRTRPQKHQNSVAFKNTLHDTNHRTKAIVNTQINHVCARCKEVIQWKIKYKKYKPLTQAKTCNNCKERKVKSAYHTICKDCACKLRSCGKCAEPISNEEVAATDPVQAKDIELTAEMEEIVKTFPERRHRTFLRYLKAKREETIVDKTKEDVLSEIMQKIQDLSMKTSDALDFSDDDDF